MIKAFRLRTFLLIDGTRPNRWELYIKAYPETYVFLHIEGPEENLNSVVEIFDRYFAGRS